MDNLAKLYYAKGAYNLALPLFQQTAKFAEKAFGSEHPQTAASLHSLAVTYGNLGVYDQALPFHQRALKIREKVLGPEHPHTVISLNNTAEIYRAMGAHDKARPLYQRALQIHEKFLGPEHPFTATSLNNLAELYRATGAFNQALPLYQRALQIHEKALGSEHLETAVILNNLALLYEEMGTYDQALPLHQRALKIKEKILGPDHPDIATSLNNLASLYHTMDAYDLALPLYQRALQINEKVLGPEHPKTATSLNNLALLYQALGAYDKALHLHQRALKIAEKILGPDHPDIATSLNNLASLYHTMGAYDLALPLYQRALQINEKVLGPEHPKTAVTLNNLAGMHFAIGEYDKVLSLQKRAINIREKVLGPEHPDTALSINNLAELYQTMGAYDKALALCQQALQIQKKVLGLEHPKTVVILNNLAKLYWAMGAQDQALSIQQQVLKIREKIFGPEHLETGVSLNNLASMFQAMGSYDQALLLFQRALQIHEKVFGPKHPGTITIINNLGVLHLAMKDYSRAEANFRQVNFQPGLVELYLATQKAPAAIKLLTGMALSLKSPPGEFIQYNTQMGLALAEEGRYGEGAITLSKAVQEIEQVRQRIKEPGASFFQAGSVGGYLRAYRGLVASLAEMAIRGEPLPSELQGYGSDPGAAAFAVVEATKGRVLLESLANAARRQTQVDIPPELRQREEKLLHQMTSLDAQWEKALAGGEEALKEVKVRQEKLRSELHTLIQELRQRYPLYASLHYPQPLPARDLPLGDREVLLEYALGDKSSYVFVVRRGGVKKLIPIPMGREELTAKVKTFMVPFNNRQVSGFSSQQAKELHDLLLAGALSEVKEGEAVIIVPDGILGLLPFEALVIQEGPSLKDHLYVGDRYTLNYYQSATIMALQRRLQKHQPQRPLFALANPVFNASDPRYAAAHGSKAVAGPTLAKAQEAYAFRGLAIRQEWGQTTKDDQTHKAITFPPLPQTEQEVRAIAQTLGVKPEPPNVLLNLNATETRLRQSPLGEYRYLHFATHADLPGRLQGVNEPFILLGQVDNAEGDDGMLTMSKVLGLRLNAELVVLSACLTGRGQVMEGEGVANFARAFQQAGARSVVVSLWEVASTETVEYMTLFYGHLKEGKSRSQALRLARQEIKAKYPQPFFWAAFILHGEG
jgi:tetratricopeptide (TPR) repeat protein